MSDKIKYKGKISSGVFYAIKENGEATDEGIVDEMLDKEVEIRQQLIDAGVIREFRGRMMTPEEIAKRDKKECGKRTHGHKPKKTRR
jgi:hypothetical protein